MKRIISMAFVVFAVTLLQAQPAQTPGKQQQQQKRGMMMMQDSAHQMMCPMGGGGMCMEHMMIKSMIPVQDGIIVAAGNQLLKYDINLNLRKVITVKLDTAQLRQSINEMKSRCKMMGTDSTAAAPQQKPGAR